MNKKGIDKYILKNIPFIVGIILNLYGYINIFSSMLLFLGGYVTIRNLLDYRVVNKNIKEITGENIDILDNIDKKAMDKCIEIKQRRNITNSRVKVRKRIK